MLDELDQLEQQVSKLPDCKDKTRMESELLSIKDDIRHIYNLESEVSSSWKRL